MRLLALRQYIEVKRQPELAGKAAGFTWKWRLHRTAAARGQDLVEDVLGLMQGAKKKDIWRPTYVTFVNTDGHEEDGEDHGGLTVEAHSVFWREVCKSPLFSDGLPAPDAPREKLFGVGRMLAKSICDDHVTGGGLSRFALEYLVHGPTGRTLASPRLALEALAECDAELAQRWRSYLDAGAVPLGSDLQLSNFDEGVSEEEDAPVTAANLVSAVHAGCRYWLLTKRKPALDALKEGFVWESIDLGVQLAPLSSEQLALMVRGRLSFSPEELVGCFRWPEPAAPQPTAEGAAEGGAEGGAEGAAEGGAAHTAFVAASVLLRAVLSDPTAIDEGQRRALLQWATGLNALPKGGLVNQAAGLIKLLPYPHASEATLPEVHTCTRDLHLPPYSHRHVVADRLHTLLAHSDGGFNKE